VSLSEITVAGLSMTMGDERASCKNKMGTNYLNLMHWLSLNFNNNFLGGKNKKLVEIVLYWKQCFSYAEFQGLVCKSRKFKRLTTKDVEKKFIVW